MNSGKSLTQDYRACDDQDFGVRFNPAS